MASGSCVSVPKGETGKGSRTWDCGGVRGFRLIDEEFRMVATIVASVDALIRLRGKKVGRAIIFLL